MITTALFAGSFDPITIGHLDIIERASRLYDKLIVCVVANPNKKATYTLEVREQLISKCISSLNNVEIDSYTGLLADYVNEKNIDVVIRGIRNTADFENEFQMASINSALYKGNTETVFLMSKPEHTCVSSSAVREVGSLGGDISKLVPEIVIKDIKHMEE